MKRQAKVTSKGQVTVPRDIRRRLGVRAGDKLEFEDNGHGVQVKAVRKESVFEKYQGIGTPGIGSGRKAVQKWLRELRGQLQTEFRLPLPRLSMGMSGDYTVAIEEGATLVRVGTAIFGERSKTQKD